jgi:hypothetical protein
MTLYWILLIGHVVLTTAGYAGLIATHAYMLYVSRSQNIDAIRAGLTAWRNSAQTFGPLLGMGVIVGFGLAGVMHAPLLSRWLIIAYVLVALALGTQAGVTIPWQLRSSRAVEAGEIPAMGPIRFAVVWMSLIYTALLIVMLVRPI